MGDLGSPVVEIGLESSEPLESDWPVTVNQGERQGPGIQSSTYPQVGNCPINMTGPQREACRIPPGDSGSGLRSILRVGGGRTQREPLEEGVCVIQLGTAGDTGSHHGF